MSQWSRPLSALALALLLLARPAWGLDLLDSYRLAKQNDRQLRIAKARAEAEAERVPQAMSQLLPNVTASASRSDVSQQREQSGVTGPRIRYESESDTVALRQPILRLRSAFALQQARHQVRGSQAELQREEQNLSVRLVNAYFDALLARDRIELLAAQRRNVETRLLAAQRALEAGTGIRTDVDEARAQLDRIHAQEIGLQQSIHVTTTQLEVLIGQGVERLDSLDIERLTPESFDPGELEPLIDLSREQSPAILARMAQMEAAKSGIRAAQSDHLPTLDLVAQYSRSLSDSPFFLNTQIESTSLGFQLNIPLYQGGATSSRVREAVALSEESKERYFDAVNTAQVQLRRDYGAIKEGIAQVRALEQALRSAEQAVFSNQRGVEAGTRTSLDVLLVEQQRFQVQVDLAQARYQMLAAWVRLNSLIGTMDEEEIGRLNALLKTTPAPGL